MDGMSNQRKTRRNFLKTIAATATASMLPGVITQARKKQNFVVIFCDDLGYGDLGVFGHPTIKTPNLDRMAHEGQKWTNFYAAASVCTPSRAGILTGRLPIRSGMCSDKRRVLFPDSAGGLPASEITIAKALKAEGYATGCVGKWHLGHLPQYLPTSHGFDSYYGIPYSNDMDKVAKQGTDVWRPSKVEYFNVPLMRDEEIIERPADQTTITKRFTEESIHFIKKNRDNPFFLYLAHSLPHVPLFRSSQFEGKSMRGIYGDVIEEIDHGVGQILETLKALHLDKDTLVVFTSDNGPWLTFNELGGSAGLLREGKGCTYEGGMREPTIFWQPGTVKPGVVHGMGSTLDLFPTFCKAAGADIPQDRAYDGYDLNAVLTGKSNSPRDEMFFYRGQQIFAARKGNFKAHFKTKSAYGKDPVETHETPVLYDLGVDPSEQWDVSKKHPDIIAEITAMVEKHKATVKPVKDQLADRL
jgi:arylsulfatase A